MLENDVRKRDDIESDAFAVESGGESGDEGPCRRDAAAGG